MDDYSAPKGPIRADHPRAEEQGMNVTERHHRELLRPPDLQGATEPGDDLARRPAAQAEAGPGREWTTYFAVRMDPGKLWDPTRPTREQAFWDGHARHMDALFEQGAVVLGGPYSDRTGSLVVVRARDVGHAREMFRDDPWTVHDVLVAGEVKAWTIFLDGRDRRRGAVQADRPSNPGDTP
jgi:hypothetical protein